MRLFISLNLPPELDSYCRKLQARFPGMKKTEEFHLTLQFLGENIPKERLPEIEDRLSKIQFTPFSITLGDAVPFGNPKLPRGIWIECRGGAPLHQLAERVRAAMGNLGYLPSESFAPHITLGRYKKGPPTVPHPVLGEPFSFIADHFYLMQSHLNSAGPRYKILYEFRANH